MKSRESRGEIVSLIGLLRRWKNAACLCIGTRNQSKRFYQMGNATPPQGSCWHCSPRWARNESETLRERIKSGLALARKRGVMLGRRKGTTLTREQFL